MTTKMTTKMLILKALNEDNREDLLEALGRLNAEYAVEYILEALVMPKYDHGHTYNHGHTPQSVLDLIKGNCKGAKENSSLDSAELKQQLLALSHRLSKLEKLHHIED